MKPLALLSTLLATSGSIVLPPQRSETVVHADDPALGRAAGLLFHHDAPFTGTVEARGDGGELVARTRFVRGQRHGVAVRWYPDGSLESMRSYRHNRKAGRHAGWWPNGNLRFVERYSAGRRHGLVQTYYEDGQPLAERRFRDGREQGHQRSWTADGRVDANYIVRDGRRYGDYGARMCFLVKGDRDA